MSEQARREIEGETNRPVDSSIDRSLGSSKLSRLILTGFMGAGKTTVGAILAQVLGWKFVDLDDVVEAATRLSVAEIFRDHGEAFFREQERQGVQQLIGEERIVLALGGGAVENESTRSLLLQTPGNCLVFLDAPLPQLLARCNTEDRVRPLLADPEMLAIRYTQRMPLYRGAHVTVETTGLQPREVCDRILDSVALQWRIDTRER